MEFLKKSNCLIINSIKIFILFLVCGAICLNRVDAATFTRDSKKVTYSGSQYTYVKKYIDKRTAYCIQLKKKAASNKSSGFGKNLNKYSKQSYVAAQIIKLGKEKWSGNSEYINIQYALGCYFKKSGYYSGGCNKTIKKLISDAEAVVSKYSFKEKSSTQTLPSVKFEMSKKTMSPISNTTNYISEKLNISNILENYGGSKDSVSYKYSFNNDNAYLCTSKTYSSSTCSKSGAITKDSSYYIYIRGNGNSGSVKLTVSGSNSSTYPSSMAWRKSDSVQQVVTEYGNVTINRSVSNSITLTYPKIDEYQVYLEKIDEFGEQLKGAQLSLYIADKGDAEEDDFENYKKLGDDLCTITSDGDASCVKSNIIDENYKSGKNYLCFSESNTPVGYKSVGTFCTKINLTNSADPEYYIYKNITDTNDEEYQQIEESVYNSYSTGKNVCITKNPVEGQEVVDDITASEIESLIGGLTVSGGEVSDPNPDDSLTITMGNCSGGDSHAAVSSSILNDMEGPSITVPPKTKTICIYSSDNSKYSYSEDDFNYCSSPTLAKFVPTSGNYTFSIRNSLNNVKISKKNITGDTELPNAVLEIYKTANGECTNNLATAKEFEYGIYSYVDNDSSTDGQDDEKVDTDDAGDENLESDGSEEESSPSDDGEDDSEENIPTDDEGEFSGMPSKDESGNYILSWRSSLAQAEISGIEAGTYCLVEKNPPAGYVKSTQTTKFEVNNEGVVKLVEGSEGDAEIADDGIITLKNNLSEISVSKQDMATSEELPGAEMSICQVDEEDNTMIVSNSGDCTPATLADGTDATWTSGTEPHTVTGLSAGTYYLVETVAPDGYDTSESIMFKMTEDGILTDMDGNPLSDNKLVMHDKSIEQIKTGDILFGVAIILVVGIVCIGFYYYKNKHSSHAVVNKSINSSNNKIKSRKIHKN